MNKKFILIIFLFQLSLSNAQTDQTHKLFAGKYFMGKYLYCETDNSEARQIYDLGFNAYGFATFGDIDISKSDLNKYRLLFLESISKDCQFCDAFFFAGYVSHLLDEDKDAFAYYYMADSLSSSPSIIFKKHLANGALRIGQTDLAKEKFNEIIDNFPNSPEGYYGNALVAALSKNMTPKQGIDFINKAYQLHKKTKKVKPIFHRMVYAISLMRIGELKKAEKIFNKLKSMGRYKNLDLFNANYSKCLFKLGTIEKNEKMLLKSKKYSKKLRIKIF